MKRLSSSFAAPLLLAITCLPVEAQDPAQVAQSLSEAHTANVVATMERILATHQLSSSHEYAARAGIEAFVEARQGRSVMPAVTDPQLPRELIDLSADPGLLTGSRDPGSSRKFISFGVVVCTIGDELLVNGRFVISVTYQGFEGPAAFAFACGMTRSAGYFYFFDRTNLEIPIKMLNACGGGSPPGHWVFAAGLTNFAVQVTIADYATGITKTYNNTLGNTFNTVIDQRTPFPCP